jgi:hypothetical protein
MGSPQINLSWPEKQLFRERVVEARKVLQAVELISNSPASWTNLSELCYLTPCAVS